VVSHIIRNKYDAENFARTERIKYEASQVIDKNTIKDEYLNKKYSAILEKIRSKRAKKIKEHIKLVNPSFDGDINIWHLIEDFLHYKDDY
jgi:tRNA A37 threonylcarbamoyladenosine dehydratase